MRVGPMEEAPAYRRSCHFGVQCCGEVGFATEKGLLIPLALESRRILQTIQP